MDVTTLDDLIFTYGSPEFCKIDVEGYEAAALTGLTQPLKYVSFEYTPELISVALDCIDLLGRLADYEYNLSRGESLEWALNDWVDAPTIGSILRAEQYPEWGDVYARNASAMVP